MDTFSPGTVNTKSMNARVPSIALRGQNILVSLILLAICGHENGDTTYKKKNIHHHGASCPKSPENILPPAAPTGAIAPKSPTEILRTLPGGCVIVRRAIAFGTTKAPPKPLRARIMLSEMTLRMKPAISWNRTQMKPAMTKAFLWPYIAPTRPPMRTNVPWVRLDTLH